MTIGPIGIFDSGVGGLTVVAELVKHCPELEFIYLGDTARVPYGTKSPEVVQAYSHKITELLINEGASSIVIACNTASAHALQYLRKEFSIPIEGVIEPGAKRAADLSQNGHIGVIGTQGTILSRSYLQAIKRYRPEAQIYAQPCPLFVPLAEEGWQGHEATKLIVESYLSPFRDTEIDTLVLGCTHYPLLSDDIKDYLGAKVTLVHSGEAMWQSLISSDCALPLNASPKRRFLATDTGSRVRQLAERFMGLSIDAVEHVDLNQR